ncbi:GDT1-like protein 4 [Zea mays]|uniref:GDT1-like protein 4 n=1 Tax=Zea mays TaxID=4577 RepID=A0A1D6KP72_MAIZE|nr:GDT1-like protein 4 [Zea mays]
MVGTRLIFLLNCQAECSSCSSVSCPYSLDQKENCNPCLSLFQLAD